MQNFLVNNYITINLTPEDKTTLLGRNYLWWNLLQPICHSPSMLQDRNGLCVRVLSDKYDHHQIDPHDFKAKVQASNVWARYC